MTSDALLADVLLLLKSRYYGKYRGTVTEVEQGGRGRIKARVPAVLGGQETGWCSPCVPYAGDKAGFVFMPEPGAGVWIEFEGGDVSYPIWSGCYWHDGQLPEPGSPARRLIQTRAGHRIVFDDDEQTLTVSDPNGNSVTLGSDGIKLVRGGGQVEITDPAVKVNGGALEVS